MVDHINGDKKDNRRQNLRFVTKQQNALNKKIRRDNSTGFKGIYPQKSRFLTTYYAKIQKGPWVFKWGPFYTAELAHEKYCLLSGWIHGEYGRTH